MIDKSVSFHKRVKPLQSNGIRIHLRPVCSSGIKLVGKESSKQRFAFAGRKMISIYLLTVISRAKLKSPSGLILILPTLRRATTMIFGYQSGNIGTSRLTISCARA